MIKRIIIISLLAMIFFVIDQVSKNMAEIFLMGYDPLEITSFMSLILVYNYGISFSLLLGINKYYILILSLIALFLVVWFINKLFDKTHFLVNLSLALIIGGALGNMYNRLTLGFVVDFIHLHYHQYGFPVFNFADVFITISAIILCYELLFRSKKEKG